MSEALKTERQVFYKDRATQLLISRFLNDELESLEPVYEPKRGYTYPIVEEILNDELQVNEFLERLVAVGILKKELYDKVIFCPNCDSPNISTRYCCPHCKAFDIKKGSLIEHVPCGYIDIEERFRRGKILVCPRCQKELTKSDVDYRKAGMWCNCNSCGKSFDIPVPSHFCRDCRTSFLFEDVLYQNVYSYSLTSDAKQEASMEWVIIQPIRQFFTEYGFEVESPGFLKGKSGANHMFDIVAFRKDNSNKLTVVDIAKVEETVSEQPVIAMFAKIYDVLPEKACLIAIPRMNENGRKMAALYKIELIEGEDQNKVIAKMEERCLKTRGKPKEA